MTQIPWLEEELWFPPVDEILDDPAGLLAAGGDLSPQRLLHAYQKGIFPWFEDGQPILWWSPSPRTVVFPDKLHISRSLKKALRQQRYDITCNQDFEGVIRACSESRAHLEGTWITEDMIDAYLRLHHLGHAHSIEAWQAIPASEGGGHTLVGGLYGIGIGRIFFGESMFSYASDASKMAFAHLAKQLQQWDFAAIDCQMPSDHLFTLGAEEIDSAQWQELLLNYTVKSSPNWCDAFKHSPQDLI